MDNVKSIPKQKLISFLKNAVEGEDYIFTVDIPVGSALNFVHRMRVELSRFREKVRERDRIPKQFKMLYIESKAVEGNPNSCTITLRRSLSGHNVSNVIDDIFDEVAGGSKIDV